MVAAMNDHPPASDRRRYVVAAVVTLAAVAALAAVALLASGGADPPTGPASTTPTEAPTANPDAPHVVVIVMENREFDDVIGSSEAPYVNGLAAAGALATNMTGVAHPSLPNYLAMVAGDTFGIADDSTDHVIDGPVLATQLDEAGYSWSVFAEGLTPDPTAPCEYPTDGAHEKKHDPFAYFSEVQNDPARCARFHPLDELDPADLPNLAWIVPDQCQDGHDCSTADADAWLAGFVPPILESMTASDLLVLTWDEGESDLGGGGHVVTIFAGPGAAPAGTRDDAPANHYSLLRTIEELFGLPPLRHAGDEGVQPMRAMLAEG
jgi:acid phosphatase